MLIALSLQQAFMLSKLKIFEGRGPLTSVLQFIFSHCFSDLIVSFSQKLQSKCQIVSYWTISRERDVYDGGQLRTIVNTA